MALTRSEAMSAPNGHVAMAPASTADPDAEDAATAVEPSAVASTPRPSASASVVRGALALFSVQPLTWAMSLLEMVVLPRYLGAEGLGQWSVAMGIALLAGTAALLGLPEYLKRQIAMQPSRAQTDGAAGLVLVLASALLLAGGLWGAWLLGFSADLGYLLPIALVLAVAKAAGDVLLALLIGQERHGCYAWLNAAGVVGVKAAAMGVLIASGDVVAYAATWSGMSAVHAVLIWRVSGLRLPGAAAFDAGRLRRLALGGLPFLGLALAVGIRNGIDVTLVGLLLPAQAAGWLAAAYRVITPPIFITILIVTPLYPALSRLAEDRVEFQRTIRRSLTSMLILMVPFSALIFALAPAVPSLLGWGPDFDNSVPAMSILAARLPLMAVSMVLATGLGYERQWLGIAVFGAGFNVVLNLVAIPVFDRWLGNGAIGAALVEVATELLMLAGALITLPRGIIDCATTWASARVLVAGLGLAAVTMALRSISLPLLLSLSVAAAAGGLVYLLLVLLLRVVGLTDLWAVRDVALQSLARRQAG